MRYQERIYIQNQNGAVRNKDILNVNMSSDLCIFYAPKFNIVGASKLDCSSGETGTTYVITTATTIPITFDFTANTNSFTATSANFKYEIYKYNTEAQAFLIPPVYKSELIQYSSFSGTNMSTQSIPVNQLGLDGDYLIKTYYEFDACTNFLNLLGKTVDTLVYRNGTQYGLYDNELDYYFIAITQASLPTFVQGVSNTPLPDSLIQEVILPIEGQTQVVLSNYVTGFFVLTLNGLVLAPNYDYTFTGNVVTLTAATVSDDIITAIYTIGSGNNLMGDNIYVTSPVVSGITNSQSGNTSYFDTTTNKYEIYTSTIPAPNQTVLVMLNGATLANGVDYYQSISNPQRIILQGNIVESDLFTIIYYPSTNVINGLTTNIPTINWNISIPPQLVNGYFILEVSTGSTFNTITYSSITPYVIGSQAYSASFAVSGDIGDNFYYRVINEKNYVTICGDVINSSAISETIPLVVQTNAINSY